MRHNLPDSDITGGQPDEVLIKLMSTRVRMADRFKEMRHIAVGDSIIAKDGSITQVTGVFPQGVRPVNKVVFQDGRFSRCCDEHLWKVYGSDNERVEGRVLDTKTIKALLDNGESLFIDLVTPEDRGGIQSALLAAYHDGRNIRKGVLPMYLDSGLAERTAYLQGVMDTVGRMGHYQELTITLIDAWAIRVLQYYVWSLGGIACINSARSSYTLSIRHRNPKSLFKDPFDRNVVDFLTHQNKTPESCRLQINLISPQPEEEEVQCISIMHPDKLFVIDDFVVAHGVELIA